MVKETKRNIVNIVNFLRTVEPRESYDLLEPVQNQLTLLRRHGLPHTLLLQYDTLCSADYIDLLLRECDMRRTEFGVWLEIVEPLALAAGLPWRGCRPVWDWHANVGFSVGYTPAQRELLIDCLFQKFHEIFGDYPRVMGSWAIDAHSLSYAHSKYGLDASCNCKDQWGTDGYTMWGGYWNGAYYPSRKNMFCPAQTRMEQIGVPVFRMLGSDPIYQYDDGLDIQKGASPCQKVITLEPSCSAGADPDWVEWYLGELFSGNCLAYAHTQAGQENSFGWKRIRKGFTHQMERLARLREEGNLEVEALGASGRWFQERFPLTPATAVTAQTDWKKQQRQTLWYNSRFYRLNLLREEETLRIRDLHLFDEHYPEAYLQQAELSPVLYFDNLPLMDGNRMSGHGILAGLFACYAGKPLRCGLMQYSEPDGETVCAVFPCAECGILRFILQPNGIHIYAAENAQLFSLCVTFDPQSEALPVMREVSAKSLSFLHNGHNYTIFLEKGILEWDKTPRVLPQNGEIHITFS